MKPGEPPLFLNISGIGILSDNARGEASKDVKVYSDLEPNLDT